MTKVLERRIDALEKEVDDLKRRIGTKGDPEKQFARNGWRKLVGLFEDDPTFDEAVRLGREYRKRQPKC